MAPQKLETQEELCYIGFLLSLVTLIGNSRHTDIF